ncbi:MULTISPECIES: DUF2213 domain-containing protein [Enterobacteriaceae]|uniref:DUF2213 domain-containing protein n=1 Tax=Enterobacteriaceae TaxID=543 RepID=UPI002E2CA1BA|nr:DUF2213 domain-containing protein [Klebsiella pneumoniae]MED6004923.1 DUF2213 domain-containing protein [Klebsiella pneumoniae]MED6058263.1 DUF2213 domain-containing protein [Klebsiella pneumoniae]
MKLIDKLFKNDVGFIKDKVTIARIGPMEYLGSELGMGLKPNDVYQVFVEPAELFSPETIASVEGVDATFIHPDDLEVKLDDWSELSVGHVQNIYQDGDYLKGTIFVKDKATIDLIEKQGIKEVSLGYTSDIIEKDGKLIKTNIRANHVAIVPEGRCGSACKIGDSKKVNTTMAAQKKKSLFADWMAKLAGGKTSAEKAVAKKFGDAKANAVKAKTKLGDTVSFRKSLADLDQILTNPEATEEEKKAVVEDMTTFADKVDEAVALLADVPDQIDETKAAVEELPVADATLPEGVSIPEELQGYVSELEQEKEQALADLEAANARIKELEDELAALKNESETATAVADAKDRFPKIALGDAKTPRQVQEKILVAKGVYTDSQVKKLTDCAVGSAYQGLVAASAKQTSTIGKKILGDSKTKPNKTASQRLGGK